MRFVLVALFTLASANAMAGDPKTERLWKAKCSSCHGEDGKAQTDQGKKMAMVDISNAAWQKKFTDDKIKVAISEGVNEMRDGHKKEMEPYKAKLNPEQLTALVGYVRGLAK